MIVIFFWSRARPVALLAVSRHLTFDRLLSADCQFRLLSQMEIVLTQPKRDLRT